MKKTTDANRCKHPLAEVFGFPTDDMSPNAVRYRKCKLCPFNNKIPNCTKDKAQAPLGVCSVFHEDDIVITCPVRFRQNWSIAEDAAKFFFGSDANWTSLSEVRLKDADGGSAGNIDLVLCEYDRSGTVTDFGALEVQAVYISGNIRNPFEKYISNPAEHCCMDWRGEPNQPRPDYLSSSRKRLAPQLIFKGGIFHSWKKKTAVALNAGFFNTLPPISEVPEHDADIAWLIYDIRLLSQQGVPDELRLLRTVYTKFDTALSQITKPRAGEVSAFLGTLQKKLDEKLSLPPDNKTIAKPFK
jgi:hypothetical protein